MTPRPPLLNQSKLLITLDGKQRTAVSKAAKALEQSMSAYIRGLIDERHPPSALPGERHAAACLRPTHEMLFRGKFLFMDCKTITDVISVLQDQATRLAAMRADGVVLAQEGIDDDYLFLRTDDPAVAMKYKMDFIHENDDDVDFDE